MLYVRFVGEKVGASSGLVVHLLVSRVKVVLLSGYRFDTLFHLQILRSHLPIHKITS